MNSSNDYPNLPSSSAPNDDRHLFYEQNMSLSSFFTHLWTFYPRFYHFNPTVDNIYRAFGENFTCLPTDNSQNCSFTPVPFNNDNALYLLVYIDLFYWEWMQCSSDQHISSRWAPSLSERIRGAPHLRQQRFIAKLGGGVRTGISLDQHVLMLKLKWIFLQLYNHPIELIWWRNWDKPWIASNVRWNPFAQLGVSKFFPKDQIRMVVQIQKMYYSKIKHIYWKYLEFK